MLAWWIAAYAAEPTVLPSELADISFETSAGPEVEGAVADLRKGAFDDAARRLTALAEAGGSAQIRYLEALARYEGGQLRLADDASRAGLALDADDPALLTLRGLVLADLGRGTEALAALDAARRAAGDDPGLVARIELNRALVHLDRGEADAADAALGRARPAAERAGDPALVARIDVDRHQVDSLRGTTGATDPLGRIGELLAAGDLAGAKAAVPPSTADRRTAIRSLLASGTVMRAEGRLDQAQRTLEQAAGLAAAAGLVREQAAATAQLGVVFGASNRPDVARTKLDEAVALVAGTSFRVAERSYRIEAGRAALRAGDLAHARTQLEQARAIPSTDPTTTANLAELRGLVAGEAGDSAAAGAAFAEAAAAHEARGAWMDAARVWCAAVQLHAADPAAVGKVESRALAAFSRARDPLGPAHVGIARGLGLAEAEDLEGAMTTFLAAAGSAEAVGSERGKQIAKIARENAAKTVVDLTDSTAVLAQADKWGVDDLVARNVAYKRGRAAYDVALVDYQAGRYEPAYTGFDTAVRDLSSIGEDGYARIAQRSRAWARFNAYTRADANSGFAVWQQLVEEGTLLQDPELRVRAMGAVALAAAELGRPEAARSLRAAAAEAEAMGLRPLAGQCLAALVEVEPAIPAKVAAARKAMELREGDRTAVYALYSAALAAYEAESYDLAIEVATEAMKKPADLGGSIREVLEAAKQAKGG